MNGDHPLKMFDYDQVLDMVMIGRGAYGKIYRGTYRGNFLLMVTVSSGCFLFGKLSVNMGFLFLP